MSVTYQHADYKARRDQWLKYEDAAAGEEAVKLQGERYLPKPNPTDRSPANRERFKDYIRRAVYYNVTGRTLKSFVGMAFSKDPVVTLPPAMAFMSDDASGSGVTLFQHAQSTLTEILKTGRGGMLADYPTTGSQASKADEASGEVRPTLSFYRAIDIRNWSISRIGAKFVLTLVVLSETVEELEEDGFGRNCIESFRVLKLGIPPTTPNATASVYYVEIWQQIADDKGVKKWAVANTIIPQQGNGQPWTEIPFTFIGAQSNEWTVQDAPLGDIATLNLAHYRNSADYEDSTWFIGQPQFYMAGLTEEWVTLLQANGTYVGSRSILPLPVGGSAGVLQAEPNTMAKAAMDAKEQQMAALGARLLQSGSAAKTATQQDSEDAVAHSVLSLAAENVSAGYRRALAWCAVFANVTGEIDFTLSGEYLLSALDAPTLVALMQLVQSGNMPQSDLWSRLRDAGYIDSSKTDDEIREEIEQDSASGMPNLGLNLQPGAKGAPVDREVPLDPATGKPPVAGAAPQADPVGVA